MLERIHPELEESLREELVRPRAMVRIYGHPIGDDESGALVSEFESVGMLHRLVHCVPRCYFFGFMVDYAGLPEARGYKNAESMPRSQYQHSFVAQDFDWKTRQGSYFSCPYGGRIEITAL